MQTEKPILAIDYGKKRIGLAISDSKGIIASPLEVLHITQNRNIDSLLNEILNIATEYKVKTLLVGSPQIFESEYSKTTKNIQKFVEKISLLTDLPIITYDESYSTTQAQNMLLSLGQNTKSSKGKIDKIAATVFLQEFLNSDSQKNEVHS
ncbi:Holliday junction resolvase RuvX [Candidatus Dojkabacteria bacterium HGW-Dojkabacteria-1]|uniref:Putative pre-16S rRNA nuclease n=1 Tax=Candidatus Dojkabacteria bacterium HGW-Dojkabacteria-1 TaxID=2013761 RepID=A0A2N2F2X8_9BACT|nr:MAG: Holliday junction resolvase RuvX [Candidatus Dojkabacteria bacterium HGW-Dojkabacteria-1]